jgi:hypothetical protein
MIRTKLRLLAYPALLAILIGCGSGGDTVGISDPVTDQTRASYSADALLMASRETEEVWISAAVAGEIDEQLSRIRAKYPEVSDIHPAGSGIEQALLEVVLIAIDTDSSWTGEWKAGKLHSGEADLDAILTEFNAKKIVPLNLEAANRTWFRIDFAQPLNLVNLAKRIKAASTRIQSVEPNGVFSDGEDISRVMDKSAPVYTFSLGWGDCPAGCIHKHYWEFTLPADKSVALREYGDDLDQDALGTGRLAPPAAAPPAVKTPVVAPAVSVSAPAKDK